MRSEEEILKKIEELRVKCLSLDRFKDVHSLDMFEGTINALHWVLDHNYNLNM